MTDFDAALERLISDPAFRDQLAHDPARALAEAGRLVAPSGRLLIVDFAPHRHDFLRAAAHRRLGFTHDQLCDWFDQVGFDCSTIVDVDPPAGDDGLTVTVWLARNRRTIKRIA